MNIASGLLSLTICLLFDHLIFEKLIHKIKVARKTYPTISEMDNDVEDEMKKIRAMTDSELAKTNLTLQGLSKFYGNNLAVNQLCLGVNTSECFGLLVSASINDPIEVFVSIASLHKFRELTVRERRPHSKC